MKQVVALAALTLWAGTLANTVYADEPLEFGVRINALHAEGNLHGVGMHLRRPLRDGFFVTAMLDRYHYDAERLPGPLRGTGLHAPRLTSTVTGVSVGRTQSLGQSRLAWFWSMGLAAGFPQVSSSSTQTGQAIVDAGTEIHLRSAIGLERLLARNWSLRAALRLERHYVDIRHEDPLSGQRASVSTLTAGGLYLALSYRF